ncbi:MAG: 2-hydroxyacid dehydrogenase [Bacilli bacterium]|nr:2-hydroxyacid dehydrogenase [Bacilli bacterium]
MKILITELNWPSGIRLLEEKYGADKIVYDPELWKNKQKLALEIADADALIVRNQTQVNLEMLRPATRLKVVGRLGVGLDNIDLQTIREKNIVVVYGKNANATSVAEYVVTALFLWSRQVAEAAQDVKEGNWNRKRFTGSELYGKTLGLIGIGEIGHRVAVRARAMGLQVIGYDPYLTPFDFPIVESGVRLVEMEELVKISDFISLHVPLTPKTRNLINLNLLNQMKPSTLVINSSRGGIINENELYTALNQKTIAGAVLDVLEQEPPSPKHPLLKLNNCIITPHIAGLTEESQVRTSELVAKEVIQELEGNVSMCRVK